VDIAKIVVTVEDTGVGIKRRGLPKVGRPVSSRRAATYRIAAMTAPVLGVHVRGLVDLAGGIA